MHPKFHGSVKWWPFRKVSTVVVLFFAVLLLLVAVEWNLLQRTHESALSATAETGKMEVAADENSFLNQKKKVKDKLDVVTSKGIQQSPSSKKESIGEQSPFERPVKEETDSYQTDVLCGGCRSLKMDHL